jgi:hypothetical protein
MTRARAAGLAWPVLVGGILTLAGCIGSGSPPTRFYVLTAVAGADPAAAGVPAAKPSLAVGVRRATLPDYLDRPQIVTRVGDSQLALAEFDRWASPLVDEFPRVLAENLGVILPSDRVAVFPWPRTAQVDYEVLVEVARFEGRLGGECALVARWSVYGREKKAVVASGKSSLTEAATGGDYAALAAAKSRLLAALSREIAEALRTVAR